MRLRLVNIPFLGQFYIGLKKILKTIKTSINKDFSFP